MTAHRAACGSMVGASPNATTMTGNYSYWNFDTAWMQGTNASGVNFSGADMTGTLIVGWYMPKTMTDTVCGGGNCTPPTSHYPDLTDVILRYAKPPTTTSSLISGTVWSNTTCPQNNVTTGAPCSPTTP